MANRDTLSGFAKTLGLDKFMLLSRYVEDKLDGRNNTKLLCDIFEAFIFALYLDFNTKFTYNLGDMYSGPGFQIVETFLYNLFDDEENGIDLAEFIINDTNHIDKLNKYFHKFYKAKLNIAKYVTLGAGVNSIKIYVVRDTNNAIIGVGKHTDHKHAKQLCAKQALHTLGILNEDYDDDNFNALTLQKFIDDYTDKKSFESDDSE
jgi:dsRNA-specific ribonuclease